ncbi:MAG: tRNA dihydrouridine synthase DusB, partial [Pseudomonadota bacterium]
MKIGQYELANNLMLAPMAGITDGPFRDLCGRMGAGLTVSEMLSSNPKVWNTHKSKARMDTSFDTGIRSVQIAGSDPSLMAEAAQFNVEKGAQIIDINMGCPAKKVNKKLAGSALLKEPDTVAAILKSVVNAVDVPVTLKIRTGWAPENKNGVLIAKIAEDSGVQSLAVHGRTRACLFKGEAEYKTIAQIKKNVSIPVIANGDITNAQQAKRVLELTNADGLMIGRAAQGNPWIFKEIKGFLDGSPAKDTPTLAEQKDVIMEHLSGIHRLYGKISGEVIGVRIARKHINWYLQRLPNGAEFKRKFNVLDSQSLQIELMHEYFYTQ